MHLLAIHVQAKGSVAAEEQVGKANARVIELEKQVREIKAHGQLEHVNNDLLIPHFLIYVRLTSSRRILRNKVAREQQLSLGLTVLRRREQQLSLGLTVPRRRWKT
jgi:hypothetical protein